VILKYLLILCLLTLQILTKNLNFFAFFSVNVIKKALSLSCHYLLESLIRAQYNTTMWHVKYEFSK